MTMSPARRLSLALQGGFFSKFSRVPIVTSSVRLCKTNSTYHRRENNISTNLICWRVLTAQRYVMARSLFEPFFKTSYCTYCEAVFLARLVEPEIVSPYHGILINTGVGNPTAPLITALGDKRVLPGKWGGATAFIRG